MKISAVYSTLKNYRLPLFFIALLGGFWSLRDIVTPYLVKTIIDSATSLSAQDLSRSIFRSLITIISIWIFMELCMRVQGALIFRTIPSIRKNLAETLIARVKTYPYPFFLKNLAGNLSDKISGTSQGIETLLSISLLSFIPILSHLLFSLILTATLSSLLAFLFLFWMILHLGITWKMGMKSLEKTGHLAKVRSNLHGKLVDGFLNIFAIKTFCRERHESQYLKTYLNQEHIASQNSQKYLEKVRLLLGLSSILMLTTTLSISYILWKQKTLSIGALTLVIILLLNLTSFLWYLSMEVIRFNEELGRVKENLKALFSGSTEATGAPLIAPSLGKLDVQNLSYGYDKPLLKNLTFSINPGKTIALTGLSGSGKTTFIHLLLSHFPLQQGTILLDGIDIKTLCLETLRKQFALVPQNPSLFHRSIRENIQYGNLLATDSEITDAAKIAHCHDFILNLSQGYDTIVGERGDKLSGGQKQRIAIARALVKKSPILILDEPTSGLDHTTGMTVLKNILETTQDRTLLVITHSAPVASLMDETIEIS